MTLEQQIYQALRDLFQGRVYAVVFPQAPAVPEAPACRFTFVSNAAAGDICGDGGPELADTRTQIDVVAKDFTAARALRLQVAQAMASLATPTLLDGGFDDYDEETKLFRCTLDFVSYPSST